MRHAVYQKRQIAAVILGLAFVNCVHAQSLQDEPVVTAENKTVEITEISAVKISNQRDILIQTAEKYLGIPYRGGGSTTKGFDCSGFVWFVYHNALNMEVPRSSHGVWTSNAKTIKLEDALPGDILVFSTNKGGKGSINHVAILLDKNSMIHAVSDGPKRGIIISPLADNYFAPRFVGVKTFLPD
jgi:cell wall-associated NlpC family hydrolase